MFSKAFFFRVIKSLKCVVGVKTFSGFHHHNQALFAHLSTMCSRGAFRVAMCQSCVVNNFFKHLLPNYLANLDQPWQECSLEGPLQKLFTEFDSIKSCGCHGNEMEFCKQFYKNLLWNHWSDFEKNSSECSSGDPLQKLFVKF